MCWTFRQAHGCAATAPPPLMPCRFVGWRARGMAAPSSLGLAMEPFLFTISGSRPCQFPCCAHRLLCTAVVRCFQAVKTACLLLYVYCKQQRPMQALSVVDAALCPCAGTQQRSCVRLMIYCLLFCSSSPLFLYGGRGLDPALKGFGSKQAVGGVAIVLGIGSLQV